MSLIESVFQLLYRFDGVISESQIRHALGITAKNDICELNRLLGVDKRFVDCCDNRWKCASIDDLVEDRPLNETTFVVTDIETTGSIRGKDRIIEIAALKIRNGTVLDRFETLVNPHRIISKQITRLTHITNASVIDSPTIEEVLPAFVEFVDNGVFVAHNSLFDFCFINAEIRRLNTKGFKNQTDICTYRIAKRLLPDVKARGINGLSLYFDYPMKDRHRAMPDVQATYFFLNKFLELLRLEDIKTLHSLIEFQKDRLGKKELKKKLKKQRRKSFRLKCLN
jgi:DNA polymerase-3 subunit epsilon